MILDSNEMQAACQELLGRWMKTGDRPHISEVTPLVVAYYRLPGNSVGGNLHVVLDDGNVGRDIVNWCLGSCDTQGDKAGSRLALVLLLCSKRQRRAIATADDARYGERARS